ncbi:MAG: response regulator [Actinomycetota bacterium]|nr:response regulator [Actinomycetota bacterium]
MIRSVLLVDGDLLALGRVEAATRASGATLRTCGVGEVAQSLAAQPADLVLIDLDRAGPAGLDALGAIGSPNPPVIAFYSHVDENLKAAAHAAGVEAWPRGRLWRSLERLLSE